METLPAICAEAWEAAVERYGPDASKWRWDADHGTGSRHPLSFAFPDLAGTLDPPRAMVGGDGDCLQCAAYGWGARTVTNATQVIQAMEKATAGLGSLIFLLFVISQFTALFTLDFTACEREKYSLPRQARQRL